MPLPYDDIIDDVHQFCERMRAKYKILCGFSPNIEDKGKNNAHVVISFIHEDFYNEKKRKDKKL